jgi:hypothetical protein
LQIYFLPQSIFILIMQTCTSVLTYLQIAKVGVNLLERLESFLEPLEPLRQSEGDSSNPSSDDDDDEDDDEDEEGVHNI